jgi:tetratricopeptide (TPR) repeat protein
MLRLILAVLLSATDLLAGDDPTAVFVQAGEHYDAGRFQAAALQYDSLLRAGYKQPQVYFNLGNAQFRAGSLGEAIWAYRCALNLAPRDADIDANLTVARLACRDRIEAAPPGWLRQLWRSVSSVLSLSEGARLVTAVWAALWAAVAFALFLPAVRRWILPAVRLLALAWVLSAATLVVRFVAYRNTQAGVVIVAETQARTAPDPEEDVAFTGHSGLECLVRGARGDYLLVELANGRVGWIPASEVKLIES